MQNRSFGFVSFVVPFVYFKELTHEVAGTANGRRSR